MTNLQAQLKSFFPANSVAWKLPLQLSCLLLSSTLLVGCGSNLNKTTSRLPNDAEVAQYNASVEPEERIVCRDEIPVGSNVPRRVCRYIKDIETTSQFHRDQLRRVLR